jgi:3-oxoacyl-[acyl-carrier-protein] synthase-1
MIDKETKPSLDAQACRIESIGMVNALGVSTEEVFARVMEGDTSCLISRDDIIPGQSMLVGEAERELPPIPSSLAPYAFRNCELLLASYLQIADSVEAAKRRYGPSRVGVILGSSTAGIAVNEEAVVTYLHDNSSIGSHAHLFQEMLSVSRFIAEFAQITGPFYTLSTACSSSTKVFASAQRLMNLGICDAVVVGGADTLSKLTVNGFQTLGLLANEVSIPFSRNRKGIVIGEGSALMLLSRLSGGTQIMGVGESSDAYHFSAPEPSGAGAVASMRMALSQSKLLPEDISYINLHGTGTPPNDKMEARAVTQVFGSEAPCSSTKPYMGHLLGASGASEIALCACAIEQEGSSIKLPPHHWDGCPDDELPRLNFVEKELSYSMPKSKYFLSNSFAFGGSNASVIVGRAAT